MPPEAGGTAPIVSAPHPESRIYSWATLALLGFISGVLCMTIPDNGFKGLPFLIGGIYGVAIAAYFWIQDSRFWLRCILVVAASSLTYFVVSYTAMHTMPLALPIFGNFDNGPELSVVLFAGATGGLLLALLIPAVFGSSELSLPVRLGKALLGSLVSAVLGVIAWMLGPSVGKVLWSILPTTSLPRSESFNFYALYPIWQTGMALLIGLLLSADQIDVENKNADFVPSVFSASASRNPRTRSLVDQKKFTTISAVALAVLFARIIPIRVNVAQWNARIESRTNERPSLENLPPLQPVPIEQALILEPIAGYEPKQPASFVVYISHERGFESAPSMHYGVFYQLPGDSTAAMLGLQVAVERYPTVEWAQYFAKYPKNIYIAPDNPKQHAVVTRFGNKVRSDLFENGGPSVPLYYMWPSANNVITVRGGQGLDDVLRAYLDRYPSSIR